MSTGGQQMQCRHVWITTCRTCGTNKEEWLPIKHVSQPPKPDADDRAGDTKQSREDWIASVIAERDLYKGECALLLAATKSAHSQMAYLQQRYAEANAEVLRLAELFRKADPTWGSPMHLNSVLAVGEPCAGYWQACGGPREWHCRCGAKCPEHCKTETAKP